MEVSPDRSFRVGPIQFFASPDFANECGTDIEARRNGCGRVTGLDEVSDHSNIDRVQFCGRVTLAAQVNKPSFPLKVSVVSARDPLKIGRIVIEFVPVNVIDSGIVKYAGNKSFGDKSMDQMFGSDTAQHLRDKQVSILANPRRDKLVGACLCNWFSLARAGGDSRHSSDTAKVGYQVRVCAFANLPPFFIRSGK